MSADQVFLSFSYKQSCTVTCDCIAIGVKFGISLGQDMEAHMSTITDMHREASARLLLAEASASSALIKMRVQAIALELAQVDCRYTCWSKRADAFTLKAICAEYHCLTVLRWIPNACLS